MNRTEALSQIENYLSGSLVGEERLRFEEMVSSDETVGLALQRARQISGLLESQAWIKPSDSFTASVVAKVGLEFELERAEALDNLLSSQAWLSPSAGFTQAVMARIEHSLETETQTVPVSRRELILDWIQGLAPAAAVVSFVVMFGKELWNGLLGYLRVSGALLDSVVGTRVFETQPLIQLGIIVPLFGCA